MITLRSFLRITPSYTQSRCFRKVHGWLLCLCVCLAQHGYSQTVRNSPNFEFGFAHVNQTNADDYIIESVGVRKYSEWQNPPITYWGPAQNDVEGVLIYRFPLPEAAGSFYLEANDSSWDFNNEPGGFGRGCSALEVSRDGVNWIVLRNSLDSRQWGVDWSYEGDLPPEMIGATEVWLRLRFLCEGAPNSSYTVTQFGRSSSAATENVFSFRAYPVLRGQPPRFNTFMLQSSQAGSTADIDNLRVIDLDTGEVVYSNDFSNASQATNNLQLYYFPQGGANTTNFVVNGPMTRVVDGKLRLETTGFGSNGSGGYESHSEAEYTQPLPHNFLVEFDAVRLQWAGHFHFHVSFRDPTDPASSHEPFGAYTTNRAAPYRLDWLRMASSGSWFQQYGLHTDAATTNSSWPISFPAPPGSLQTTHKLGISLSNNIASFYLDGRLLNSAPIDNYLGSSGDFDSDGVNDYRERQDGTDPNNPNSFNLLSKGLVAYYPFNGNANDESGYGNHGVPQGVDPAADRFGNSGKAYSFTGSAVPESNIKVTGDAVNIPGGKTFSAWVKYEGGQENPRIFSTAGYEVSVNAGSRFAANQTHGGSVDTLEAPESSISGRFAHVVAVWSDSGMSLYIDGLPAASKPWDGSSEADFSRGFFPEIGGNSGAASDPFGGVIDDLRVYSRALSAREVGQIYQLEAGNMDSDGDGLTDVWERGFGRFSLISGSFDLSAAQQDAKARGGKLATFSTAAEWHAASSSLPEVVFAWIGATDSGSEGSWRWFDGTDWAFSNWGVGEPNNQDGVEHYVQIWGSFYSGQTNAWNDVHPRVTSSYLIEYGYPTDPLNPDSDSDGLTDGVETGTGVFLSSTDTGTNPLDSDTSGDGILDGEAVLWNFNPLTDHTQVLAFLRHATSVQSGRFALFTEGSIMDLNLGGVMIQKSGSQASVRFKVESKMDLRDPAWTDRGTYLLPPIDMPGSKGFLRIRAEQP